MGLQGFSERFTNLRKERGLTQEELAVRFGVTPQAISKWERGTSYPDIDLLCSIGKIMDCSLDYLLDIEVKNNLIESNDEVAQKRLLQNILADPLVFETGAGLVYLLIEEKNKDFSGIQAIRERLAAKYGILLPLVRIKDNLELGEFEYRFSSYDKILSSKTISFKDAISMNSIYQHFEEVCQEHYNLIINRQIVKELVDNVAAKYPAVVNGVIPVRISFSKLQDVLSMMVQKKASIHNLIKIIEILEDNIEETKDVEELVNLVIGKF
ncbi:MAG: transcriptional regulator, family [Clostridiales bacterium]|nr:transcriptional regulator, family [Clostridiales bacterium]